MEVENITNDISTVEVDESDHEPSRCSASPPLTNHDLPQFPVPAKTFVFTKNNSCTLLPCTETGHLSTLSDVSSQLRNTEGMKNNYYLLLNYVVIFIQLVSLFHYTVYYVVNYMTYIRLVM